MLEGKALERVRKLVPFLMNQHRDHFPIALNTIITVFYQTDEEFEFTLSGAVDTADGSLDIVKRALKELDIPELNEALGAVYGD